MSFMLFIKNVSTSSLFNLRLLAGGCCKLEVDATGTGDDHDPAVGTGDTGRDVPYSDSSRLYIQKNINKKIRNKLQECLIYLSSMSEFSSVSSTVSPTLSHPCDVLVAVKFVTVLKHKKFL